MNSHLLSALGAGTLLLAVMPALSAPASSVSSSPALLVGGVPMTNGPFDGTIDGLRQYRCPAWFRDAKFGIWAHWGPQSVPMEGDWYARRMYEQGSGQNVYHVEHYGPPAKFGYKDIIPLWKAEKWDPDHLMGMYVKAGAKYFVSMGVHHDNFDLWNSKYNFWNAVNLGPHRDVVGTWQRAAQKYGLPFGVSEHLGASYNWYQASHGADKTGPLAGVPYDGADPMYWSLYHKPSPPGDTGWLTNDPENQAEWQRRIRDLVDQYHPDLLYSDSGLPFDAVGAGLVSQFYNSNIQNHAGKLEAVYTCKQTSNGHWVQDVERGVLDDIDQYPWQTDTSMGDWFYSRHQGYKTPATVVHMLCDIVSKNGNLLLNIVQRPDGSIDDASVNMLQELAAWMPINGEAIYGTRPWTVYGEGTAAAGGMFHEDQQSYTASDIRFTRKGDTLYAIALGWPQGGANIKALALGSPLVSGGHVHVQLLGSKSRLSYKRTTKGLEISLPAQAPCKYAVVFKITGLKTVANVNPLQLASWRKLLIPGSDKTVQPQPVPAVATPPVQTVGALAPLPAPTDVALVLTPDKAELHGQQIKVQGDGDTRNIGFWDNSADSVSWDAVTIPQAGTYRVVIQAATVHPTSDFVVDVAGQKLPGHAVSTGDWSVFQPLDLGTVELKTPGTIAVKITTVAANWQPINVQSIRLIKTAK